MGGLNDKDDIDIVNVSPPVGSLTTLQGSHQKLEDELRRKALLSLAKRRREESISVPTSTQVLSIPSSSTAQPRFVISVSARSASRSSFSSSEDEVWGVKTTLPSVTLSSHRSKIAPPPKQNKNVFHLDTTLIRKVQTPKPIPVPSGRKKAVPIPPSPTTKTSKPAPSYLQPYKRLILKQSLRVERLQKQLRHQEEVLASRKKDETFASSNVASLKIKLFHFRKLLVSARHNVAKATRDRHSTKLALIQARNELSRMNLVVERLSKKLGNNKSVPKSTETPVEDASLSSVIELHKHFTNLLKKLQVSFKISSPLFNYFNLFAVAANMPVEVEMTPASPDGWDPLPEPLQLDPNIPICPFYLNGSCKDTSCVFQHPDSCSVPSGAFKTSLSSLLESVDFSNDLRSNCCVCGTRFRPEDNVIPESCSTVADWHAVFATCDDWTPFLDSSLDLANLQDISLLKHHLHAILVTSTSPVDGAVNFLQATNFNSDIFSFAFNSSQISLLSARRELLRKSLSWLLAIAHEHASSLCASVGCMNALLFVIYHTCRLEWEACGSKVGLRIIEDILKQDPVGVTSCLPPKHLARWALWYIRVILLLSPDTFPQSLDYCPIYEPEKLANLGDFFNVAVVDLGLSTDYLSELLLVCNQESIPMSEIFPVLAFGHIYVQFLAAVGDSERGVFFCLRALLNCEQLLLQDNLLFPTAIYLSNICLQKSEPGIFDLVSDFTNQHSLQTTFAYCFACLMQESGNSDSCISLLTDLVTGHMPIPSHDRGSIYSVFRKLLGLDKQVELVNMYDSKNASYLWMCFGLFSMLDNASSSLLPEFLNHVITRLSDYLEAAFPCPLAALLLHLGLALANTLPTAKEYSIALNTLFFPPSLTQDMNFCSHPPSWFIEILQYVQVDKFSESYPPTPLFSRLVETYGYRVLKALFASSGFSKTSESLQWLQSLCHIARLEQPIDEEFWLMVAALSAKFYPPESQAFVGYLIECLSEAVKVMPLSCKLWQLFALVVKNYDFGKKHWEALKKKAPLGMISVVEGVFESSGTGITPQREVFVASLACQSSADWWNRSS